MQMQRAPAARRVPPIALAILVTASACSAGPAASMGASVQASAAASPGPTQIAHLSTGPVLRGSDLGGTSFAVLPGAFTIVDGIRHAFLVGFGNARGDHGGRHATSPDGLTWTLDDGDPLLGIDLELTDPGPIPSSVLRLADGSWAMYLWGVPGPGRYDWRIWRATAPAAEGPWMVDPDAMLAAGAGAWDSAGVTFGSAVATDDGFLMAYDGASLADPNTASIGIATSTDGVKWAKRPEPIITPGLCGAFDTRSVTQPRLVATDGGFLIAYSGNGPAQTFASIGLAWSTDGEQWSCAPGSPILDGSDVPGSDGIHTVALAATGNRVEVLVESLVGGAGGSELWLAELTEETP